MVDILLSIKLLNKYRSKSDYQRDTSNPSLFKHDRNPILTNGILFLHKLFIKKLIILCSVLEIGVK